MAKNDKKIVALAPQQAEGPCPATAQNIRIDMVDKDYNDVAIEFKDIIGHQVGQHWVAVLEKNTTHVYPASRIEKITVETVNKE